MAALFVDNAFSAQWPSHDMSTETQIKQAASRNAELLGALARTDSAKPALKQQNEYIDQLQTALTKVADKAKQLALVRQKEEKDHQSYHESVMRRFAYKVGGKEDKFIEKASKEEREYFEALRGEKRAQEEGKSLTEQLQAALHTKSQLEPIVAESNHAQKELDDLYNAIFEGQTVSFPEEDAQEMAAMQARNESEHLQFVLSRETQVKQLLADARVSMIEALSRIEGALDNSRVDMFGGGALWDYLERRDLGKVDQAINEVHRLVVQAQRLSPYVLPLGSVSVAQNSLMGDVLFDK